MRDIDEAIAYLREHDVNVEDWHEIDMVRLSTFYDPDGTSWMLAQPSTEGRTRRDVDA